MVAAARRRPPSASPRVGRRLAGAALVLAILSLPALLAGARLDAPPQAGELALLAAAGSAAATAQGTAALAQQFFQAPVALWGADPTAPAALLGQARLVQMLALFALAGCLYLAVLQARGRLQAMLGCLFWPLLPPVGLEAQVLRAELPALLFGCLGLLVLQTMAREVHRRQHASRWSRWPVVWGCGLTAAVALGLAVAAQPLRPVILLLPFAVLVLAALQLAVRALRLRRRCNWWTLPIQAMNRRLWPWTATALLAPAAAAMLLQAQPVVAPGSQAAAPAAHGLWPVGYGLPLQILAGLGAVAAIWRIGLRFGRGGRIGADLVLLVYVALGIAGASLRPANSDQLASSATAAMLLAEGTYALFGGVWWWRWRRRQRHLAG
jgi:hypothetical protein